jgi:hypothetical protein
MCCNEIPFRIIQLARTMPRSARDEIESNSAQQILPAAQNVRAGKCRIDRPRGGAATFAQFLRIVSNAAEICLCPQLRRGSIANECPPRQATSIRVF